MTCHKPQNDALSACLFFSLRIIDKFLSPEYIMSGAVNFVQNLTFYFRISNNVPS